MNLLIPRLLISIIIAYFAGKLVSKFRLPAILGWLVTGMLLGPHALGIISDSLVSAAWYRPMLNIFETAMGVMIGSELVLRELKRSGKQIVIATMFQSIGTFIVVSLLFGVIFYFMNIPLYLAVLFGCIALATAPAPALSIVKEFNADGPVTRTLIPMAALDDVVAIVVFFSINTILIATHGGTSTPLYITLALMILLPIAFGILFGLVSGVILKKKTSQAVTLLTAIALIVLLGGLGLFVDQVVLAEPVLNYMLIGMAFAATFANMVSEERLAEIMDAFNPVIMLSLMIVILNLGAPLDYKLIVNAGLFTAIYILARAIGKYSGAYIGAKATKMPDTVKKYLGFTLLPHSGVSLVFTGIAATTLHSFDPASAVLLQGTIAAAAIINEIIAVILAKNAFKWAGELQPKMDPKAALNLSSDSVEG